MNKIIADKNISDNLIDTFLKFQKKTSFRDFDLKYLTLGMCGEMGEVANEVKKMERDDNGVLTDERRHKIITELGDVMWYIGGLCNSLDISFNDLFINNMKKIGKIVNKI